MPAQAFEDAISERLATQFDQPVTLISQAGLNAQPCQMERFALACKKTAVRLRQRSRQTLRRLIARIEVGGSKIIIEISTSDLAAYLKLPLVADVPQELRLTIEAQLRRSGKVVRLVEASGKAISTSTPQPHIVRLLQLAQRWWREMQDDQLSVTEMATRHSVDRAYVSRVIRLSFLAPRIVEQILAGEQAAEVDARSLLRLHSFPLSWEEQERRYLAR